MRSVLISLVMLCMGSCGVAPSQGAVPGTGQPDGGTSRLEGGVLVMLEDSGERFQIWVTEPLAVETLIDVWEGRVGFTNITGPLRSGSGAGQHNHPWSWHIDPAKVLVNIHTFAPVYSGTPSEVEADLAALIARGEDKMTSSPIGGLVALKDLRGR
jgi:hypothetical protein